MTIETLREIVIGAVGLWIFLSAAVADFGRENGYSFFLLFLCALFLGFPLVLLAIVISVGPEPESPQPQSHLDRLSQ